MELLASSVTGILKMLAFFLLFPRSLPLGASVRVALACSLGLGISQALPPFELSFTLLGEISAGALLAVPLLATEAALRWGGKVCEEMFPLRIWEEFFLLLALFSLLSSQVPEKFLLALATPASQKLGSLSSLSLYWFLIQLFFLLLLSLSSLLGVTLLLQAAYLRYFQKEGKVFPLLGALLLLLFTPFWLEKLVLLLEGSIL